MKPIDMKILVMGPGYWGKGDTLKEALKNARNPKKYIVYICHPKTTVDAAGCIWFPAGMVPKEVLKK